MRAMKLTIAALGALAATPALGQAPQEDSAYIDMSCDRACLLDALGTYMGALAEKDPAKVDLAPTAQFTENNVVLKLGKGLWGTVTAVDKVGLEVADPYTGNAAWFGSVRENGKPAILALRIHVKDGKIDEIESVVHRETALPAPFGDTDNMVHDPDFNKLLPPEERRPRPRMRAIADSYFNTVEFNDGQVLAPFAEDCGRLENGISTTTRKKDGAPGFIVDGCEAQFKLGLYRINKRIRERQYPIIDVERGIVVASGFFDHANEWDRYLLTDGREMRTALQWPNSITLLEAFRIKDAEISRIEAVFTYVPYFMHNPWAGPDSSAPKISSSPEACNEACLTNMTESVMTAYVTKDWDALPWAKKVGYSENGVGIRIGESIWMGITATGEKPLIIADEKRGQALWVGRIEEHGQPAWAAITVRADGDKIGAIDAVIRRSEYGMPYVEPTSGPSFKVLRASQQTSSSNMLAAVDEFYAAIAKQDGTVPSDLSGKCKWFLNGFDLAPCGPSFTNKSLQHIEGMRSREVLAVDEARGLVAITGFEDFPASPQEFTDAAGNTYGDPLPYPRTLQVVVLFNFKSGKLQRVESLTSELPYGMGPR